MKELKENELGLMIWGNADGALMAVSRDGSRAAPKSGEVASTTGLPSTISGLELSATTDVKGTIATVADCGMNRGLVSETKLMGLASADDNWLSGIDAKE